MKKYILIIVTALMLPIAAMAESQSWDFTSYSDTDITNMGSDSNWTYDSDNGRYCYNLALSAAALTANGTELEATTGLLFTASVGSGTNGKIRVNPDNGRFELNGSKIVVTIPDLTAGQTVTVVCITASSSTARSLDATNLTSTTNFGVDSTDKLTCTGTVEADGSVTLTTTDGGINLYSITVADATSSNSGSSSTTTTTYNSVSYNASYNQAKIVLSTGDVLYYNTDEVSIAFDDDSETVTVTGTDFTDEIVGLAIKVSFNVADNTTASGTITDIEGAVVITEAKGWFESVYAEWEPLDGAASYNVYVKGGNYTDYTLIDDELIRYYDGYVRADMVGLVAGDDYALKIVPVDSDGNEVTDSANEATDMAVVNYSRDGFAHFDYSDGIGAYNNDGSLKSGARVIYVYADNADDVTCTVQTGSSSTTTYTGMQQIIYGYQKGYDTTPIAFRIIGTITEDDIDELLSSEEGLQVKGKNSYSEMNITIEGIGEDAVIHGFGILIRNCTSVELRNFALMKFMDDGVSIDTDNSHIWVHNLDIFYGQVGSDSDQKKGDGSLDIKGDSQYITVYNNRFWDSGKCSLCGMTSETGPNYITYHHNWFDHSDSRHARVRTMSVHLFNNYYDGNAKYGVGSTMGSSVFVDRNYFRAAKYPMLSSMQGTDAAGDGTFSEEAGGIIKSYGNVFAENQSSFSFITYSDNNTSFDAYDVDDPATTVPSSVVTLEGGTCYDNFDTDASLMYDYTADDADDVPTVVTGYYGAGRLNHGDFSYNIDDETSSDVDSDLQDAVFNYTSTLVSIQGAGSSSSTTEGTTENTESGSTSGSTVDTSETIIVSFTDKESSNTTLVSVETGNYSTCKGTATYNGTTYSTCLKMESSTSVTITTEVVYDVTLVFGDSETASFKWDGTETTGSGSTYTFESLAAGTYALTKNASVNLYAVVFVPVSE